MKIKYDKDTYSYFSKLNSDINHGKILDYGCNWGTFLSSSKNNIDPTNYVGVDVDLSSLSFGRNQFPDARFITSNYYNLMYNGQGKMERPSTIDYGPYNTIISYRNISYA